MKESQASFPSGASDRMTRLMMLRFLVCPFVLLVCAFACAQDEPHLDPKDSTYHPPTPTVIFDLDFPGATPSHYSVAVNANGNAAYQSNGGETDAVGNRSTGDPNIVAFTMSEATRNRIFQLAQKLNYFSGNFDYTKTRVANTGVKTLVFADLNRHNATTYNYSVNADVQELTSLFQRISATMEYGRRLEAELRYNKLDLYKELQRMRADADGKSLAELQAVAPVLRKISGDHSIMRVARAEADRLLAKAGERLPSR